MKVMKINKSRFVGRFVYLPPLAPCNETLGRFNFAVFPSQIEKLFMLHSGANCILRDFNINVAAC